MPRGRGSAHHREKGITFIVPPLVAMRWGYFTLRSKKTSPLANVDRISSFERLSHSDNRSSGLARHKRGGMRINKSAIVMWGMCVVFWLSAWVSINTLQCILLQLNRYVISNIFTLLWFETYVLVEIKIFLKVVS